MPHGPRLSYIPDFDGRTALYRRLVSHDLNNLEVRVFTVWPNEDFSSPLEGTLEIRSLLKVHTKGRFYDALSYYWGSANDLEHVIIHGSDEGRPTPSFEVPVTRNLTSALRHLRKKATAAGEILVMWTDAVCINQRDAQERSEQIAIISGIFHASRRVLVWLSDRNCSKLAGVGFKYIANICGRFDICEGGIDSGEEQIASHIADQGWDVSELVDSVEAFICLPYWHRGWILQEISALHIPILLTFEDETCSLVGFDMFVKVLGALRTFSKAHDSRPQWLLPLATSFHVITVPVLGATGMYRHCIENKNLSPNDRAMMDRLLDVFLAEKVWHTSDPRDNVFVLRRIHPAFTGLDRARAGYHTTVEQVFTFGTISLLDEGTWSRLCWCVPSQSPYLPSWVVDFSTSKIHTFTDSQSIVDREMLHRGKFDACAGSDIRCNLATTPHTLQTAAFLFDEIEGISRCLTTTELHHESCHESWIAWFTLISDWGLSEHQVAILRTICAGLALRNERFAPKDVLLFCNTIIGQACKTPKLPTPEEDENALRTWKTWIRRIALSKRFFITKVGRMGLASNAAAVGDHIAIFASGRLPFVVRKVHANTDFDAHILMGTCYLDGEIAPTDV